MELNKRFRKAISVAAMSAGMLIGGAGFALAATVIGTSITLDPGAGLQTGTTATNTALLQAYDVDGTAYTTFATLTANNTPTMDLAAAVTIGGELILNAGDLGSAANKMLYTTAADTYAEADLTAFARTVLDDADAATALATLGATTVGGNLFDLTNPSAVTFLRVNADNTVTALSAADTRTALGLVISTDVQAYDAVLTSWAGKTVPTGTAVGTSDTQTLTSKTLTSPAIGTSILDTNGLELFLLTATASAVNEITYANAATGTAPSLAMSGDNTNIGLSLVMKGTGVATVSTTTTNADSLALLPAAGGGAAYTGTLTSADLTGNVTWTLPAAADTLVGRDTTDTLTNKTLTAPAISSISNSGTLTLPTSTDTLVGRATTDTLTNKTLDADGTGNALSNVNGDELDSITGNNYGVPIIWKGTVTSGATVSLTTDAPFKFRVLDAWSVAASADGGTWKLDDGTNDITDAVTVTGTDKTINRAGTIDDAYYEIAATGTLRIVGDSANADVEVYVMLMRVD
jgi:hypothetical protein